LSEIVAFTGNKVSIPHQFLPKNWSTSTYLLCSIVLKFLCWKMFAMQLAFRETFSPRKYFALWYTVNQENQTIAKKFSSKYHKVYLAVVSQYFCLACSGQSVWYSWCGEIKWMLWTPFISWAISWQFSQMEAWTWKFR
jgi:hypothetical protein